MTDAVPPPADAIDASVADSSSYDLLKKRLEAQGDALLTKAQTLNAARIEQFGQRDQELLMRLRAPSADAPTGLAGAAASVSERRGEADEAGAPVPHVDRPALQRVELGEDVLGLGIELLGLLGRHQPAADAIEQLESELVLGVKQDLAQRRLRDVEHRSRAGDGAATHQRAEDFELARPHLSSHQRR